MRSRPRGRRGDRRPPAPRLAEGRGQLHEVAPPSGVDRQDRDPCHRGCVLGLGAMAAECARTCVVALHRRAQRPDRAARPPFGHRLARRQLEGELPLGRDRARGLHLRPGRLHRRAVPVVGPPRSLDRAPLVDADRPEAHHRPRAGAGARRWPRWLVAPHRSGPALELAPVPPARAPLRRLREAERDATAPAGDAARRRPVAGEGRPVASRASSSRSTAAWSGSTGEPRSRSPAAAA